MYYLVTVIDGELKFLHGMHLPRCTAEVEKYFYGYHTLQFMTCGHLRVSYNDKTYDLSGRWVWPAWPGPLIRFTFRPPAKYWDHRYIAFSGPLVQRWQSLNILPEQPQPAPESLNFDARFDQLLDCYTDLSPLGQLKAINLLESLLIELAELRNGVTKAETGWFEKVTAMIADSSAAKIDYADIARRSGVSLSTLRRRFKIHSGKSIHSYALEVKIARARELLVSSEMPIKAIADALGYKDMYFFSRQFSQLTGMPPGEFRRALK